jgi:hypothetical protein
MSINKINIGIAGPMCSGKTTLLLIYESLGYEVHDDNEFLLDNKQIEAWPKHGQAAVIWGPPVPGWFCIFFNIADVECIKRERTWPPDQIKAHFKDMIDLLLSNKWDLILDKSNRDCFENILKRMKSQ